MLVWRGILLIDIIEVQCKTIKLNALLQRRKLTLDLAGLFPIIPISSAPPLYAADKACTTGIESTLYLGYGLH